MQKPSACSSKIIMLQMVILLGCLIGAGSLASAQGADQGLQINYRNSRLSIVARDVGLKRVLLKIAEITGINVKFPADLKSDITLSRNSASLKSVLKSILKGWNYAIIFSGPNRKEAEVAEVLIFSKKQPAAVSKAQGRKAARIRSYEMRIDTVRQRLSQVDPDSSAGKSYLRQIERFEKMIEKLEH